MTRPPCRPRRPRKGQARAGGCPGSRMRMRCRKSRRTRAGRRGDVPSQLRQLAGADQARLARRAVSCMGADLLIAADCTAYAYGAFPQPQFMRGTVIASSAVRSSTPCSTAEKLTEMFRPERHPLHHTHAHGGAVLRRHGVRHPHRARAGRQTDPVPHRRPLHRRRDSGGSLIALLRPARIFETVLFFLREERKERFRSSKKRKRAVRNLKYSPCRHRVRRRLFRSASTGAAKAPHPQPPSSFPNCDRFTGSQFGFRGFRRAARYLDDGGQAAS